MNKDIDLLYKTLTDEITEERLKEISSEIILHYRERNINRINFYGEIAGIPTDIGIQELFSCLIKIYHPDKHKTIHRQILEIYERKEYNELLRIHEIYLFDPEKIPYNQKYEFNIVEEYHFDGTDFGYHESVLEDEVFFDDSEDHDYEEKHEEYGFIEAINDMITGNLLVQLTPGDLQNLEGELDLSDYHIHNLEGIEHCTGITHLNLSGNNIEKLSQLKHLVHLEQLFLSENEIETIEPLSNLTSLKEVDLSFNNIENIDSLLSLKELSYINLIGNPCGNSNVIEILRKRGATVIL